MTEKQQTKTESLGITMNVGEKAVNLNFGDEYVNEKYRKTPIRIMGGPTGFTGCLIPYRVTEVMKTKEEVQEELDNPSIETVMNVVGVMMELQRKEDREEDAKRKIEDRNTKAG